MLIVSWTGWVLALAGILTFVLAAAWDTVGIGGCGHHNPRAYRLMWGGTAAGLAGFLLTLLAVG